MGTKYIRKEIITDTYTTITVQSEHYQDFEDGDLDGYYGMAVKVAFGLADIDVLNEYTQEDIDVCDLEPEFETRHVKRIKDIEVCEWCESPFCDGDYDNCSDAPVEDEDEEEDDDDTQQTARMNEKAVELKRRALDKLLEDAPEIESKI